MYVAQKGHDAYVEDLRNGYRVEICRSPDNALAESVLIYDAGIAKREAESKTIFSAFLGNVGWVRIFGIMAIDLSLIALGSADLLVSNIPKPMDIAPGCLFIEEARDIITDFQGNPWSMHSKNIVVGNKQNHADVLRIVQQALEQ